MHAIRQKCRPKHQVLILKCYPRTTKGAVDVKPNSSELSYLLYYATTRRSKVQKVGAFLEKKTASDVWRVRIGNVQVTLQILAALIEKAPRDLPLYAPYVLKILNLILKSRDITMLESSIPTFEAFCEHHDGASLSADQEYLHQYEEIVRMYTSFASTRQWDSKTTMSPPMAMRWRNVGLQAIKSICSSDALASVAGRQLDVVVPILLENIWTDSGDFLDVLESKAKLQEKEEADKTIRRRMSTATVRTVDTSAEGDPLALSGSTADADMIAEQNIGVLALQCLQQVYAVNNRTQIYGATTAALKFIADRVAQNEKVLEDCDGHQHQGWATRIFQMIARWTPVQDRYVILVTAMEILVRSPLADNNLQQQLVLATMIDSLLKSDINLIGLSVMDVLLGLIQHVLRVLQLDGATPHMPQENGSGIPQDTVPPGSVPIAEIANVPTNIRVDLLTLLQQCIGHLATHVYYADQITDMISTLLGRLKPSPLGGITSAIAAVEDPIAASAVITSAGDLSEDPSTDGFFSFDTAKIKALEAVKSILIVAGYGNNTAGGSLGRNRVPIKVWEGTQWLLRDGDGKVRKAYVDAVITWLDREVTKSDLRVLEEKTEKSKGLTKTSRDESATNLTKRAVSNASNTNREKPHRHHSTFLPLLHLAIYENALQFVDCESDIVLLHLLLANLVQKLGVNAVKSGLPMVFRLQEDIHAEVEAPISKIRLGSLCHGYFWILSENFDFDTSPTGRAINTEIHRRRSKSFWIESILLPPLPIDRISTPGRITSSSISRGELESEALLPFDERFQMVKLISLSYAESGALQTQSPPTSPGRSLSFSQPILATEVPSKGPDHNLPESFKEQMMSEWNREAVMAVAQESSKTISISGSRTGTTSNTLPRNFLAVNGNMNNGGTSGTNSPHKDHQHHSIRSRPNSTSYGLVGGLGIISKLRNGHSPSPPSDSSRASVTRVDQLKRVLSGQQSGSPVTGHSDASSDSMQNLPPLERSVSQRAARSRSRSKSADRDQTRRPLSSHPVLGAADLNLLAEESNIVPPVPPIPSSMTGSVSKTRSVKRNGTKKSTHQAPWGEGGPVIDLQDLLREIDTSGEKTNTVHTPPY